MHNWMMKKTAPLEEILAGLKNYGVLAIPNYFDASEIERLRQDFFRVLETEKSSPLFLKKKDSRVARINWPGSLQNSALGNALSSPLLLGVARHYFEPFEFLLNDQVYVQHDVDALEFNETWHIDPSRCLKFGIYLNDVTEQNGAMHYALGSHREGFFRIMYYKNKGLKKFPQTIPENEIPYERIQVTGPAGTLFIFEAAGIHKGGSIAAGQQRMVVRGHTFAKVGKFRRKICNLIARSPLNLGKYRPFVDDFVADAFRTESKIYY